MVVPLTKRGSYYSTYLFLYQLTVDLVDERLLLGRDDIRVPHVQDAPVLGRQRLEQLPPLGKKRAKCSVCLKLRFTKELTTFFLVFNYYTLPPSILRMYDVRMSQFHNIS